MENKPQTSWDAIQAVVRDNPRIHAIHLYNYAHLWIKRGQEEQLYIHDNPPRKVTRRQLLSRPTTTEELRDQLPQHGDMTQYWNTALVSEVDVKRRGLGFLPGRFGKKRLHFTLLDMDLSVSDEHLKMIQQRAAEELVPKYGHFFIVESGRSYHLISLQPISPRRLRKAYGISLLMDINSHISPDGTRKRLVDSMYIGHCLADRNGRGSLRITGNAVKPVPRVVGYI